VDRSADHCQQASFTDWLVSVAGGTNIFADMSFDSGQVGLESLIQKSRCADFSRRAAPFIKTLSRRPGWSSIRGVRDGRFASSTSRTSVAALCLSRVGKTAWYRTLTP
jgi:ABC-type Fe3+-hydroxamate transport system substrate-binding protein